MLFTLDNGKLDRPFYQPSCSVANEAERKLSIADVDAGKHELLLYRGDIHTYGLFDVVNRRFDKLCVSPFVRMEDGRAIFDLDYATWAWRV